MSILLHLFRSHWFWLTLIVVLVGFDFLLFLVIPGYAKVLQEGGDRRRAIRLLEGLARLPALTAGEGAKALVRYRLGVCYALEGRFADAANQFRFLLEHKVPPGLEADVRRRLADSLDGLGRETEGDAERQKAREVVQGGGDLLALLSRGDLLKREHRYDEALAVYEQALSGAKGQKPAVRAEIMVKMCLTAFDGGHPDLTIRWAEAAIAEGAQGLHLRSAHSMAGNAYGNRGDFAEAERHTRTAYELALGSGDKPAAARSLAMVASFQMRQGRVREALETAERSLSEVMPSRAGHVVRSEVLQVLGRFEEARRAMIAADEVREPGQTIAFYNKRQHGVTCLGLARILTEEGRPEQAWDTLQEAVVAFAGDAKLSLWCDASAARLLALMGRHEQAREKMTQVAHKMDEFPDDRSGRLSCLSALGYAAFALEDFATALDYWNRYLEAGPDLVWRPRGLFHQGECLRRLGNMEGARAVFEAADALGLDTYDAQRARQALHALILT